MVEAVSRMIKKESAIYGQISDEEWEAIRLTKKERRDGMFEIIRVVKRAWLSVNRIIIAL